MESEAIASKLYAIIRPYWVVVLLGLLGFVFFLYGLMQYFWQSDKSSATEFQVVEETELSPQNEELVIDVSGAVGKPGVYRFVQGERIGDAIAKAGGLLDSADKQYVAQSINLALQLSDGLKIYIPFEGEEKSFDSSVIHINSASVQELDSLSGIGKVTAQKIIEERPFSTLSELVTRKIISESVFAKIEKQIAL